MLSKSKPELSVIRGILKGSHFLIFRLKSWRVSI